METIQRLDTTTKRWMIALGAGLVILWLVGYRTASWVLWFDLFAGLLSIAIGVTVALDSPAKRAGVPLVFAIALGLIWLISLAGVRTGWRTWWTFAFACAYLLGTGVGPAERPVTTRRSM
jgi:hypothetical protein